MCAYAPGITYNGGESIARSLDSAFSDIAGGIMERSKKRQEKEQLAAATKALQPLVEKLAPGSGVDLTKDVPKEAIPQFLQLAGQIGEQQRTAPLRDLQLENEKLRQRLSQQQIDEAAANAAALNDVGTALQSGDFRGALSGYLKKGGTDPRMLAQLGDFAMQPAAKPVPGSLGTVTEEVPGVGTLVRDRATGEPISAGNFTRPDRKTDEKALTQTEIQQIGALEQSGRDLDALESAFTDIGDADFGGPLAGRIRNMNPLDTNVGRIRNLVTAATPNLARGVFREVGVLTDADVERYQKLLPNVNDTAAQRKQKFADLRKRLESTRKETLGNLQASGRDVAGIQEKVAADAAPDAPASITGFDGKQYSLTTIGGKKGIIREGKFFPLIQ